MSEDPDYKVGKGRPPMHTRFQKGVCPNPKGRPKGSRNLASSILKRAEEKVVVTINGSKQKVTKIDAAMIQVANKAAAGDHKSLALLFSLVGGAEAGTQRESAGRLSLEERRASDVRILELFVKRLRDQVDDDGEDKDG